MRNVDRLAREHEALRLMIRNRITIGLDLGDRSHAACVLSASGDIIAEHGSRVDFRHCRDVFDGGWWSRINAQNVF